MSFLFKQESIFDHNPTPEELAWFGLESKEQIIREKEYMRQTDTADLGRICHLFKRRGDKKRLDLYFKRAQEDSKIDSLTLGHELAGGCIQSDLKELTTPLQT